MGYVMAGGQRPMTSTRYHVLRHVERVRHQLALELDEDHWDAFASWAQAANALFFFEDGSVRAPNGRVLVDPETGDPEEGADVPYPSDATRRKEATEAALHAAGIRTPRSLPPVVSEVEVMLRPAQAVAARCLSLFVCALRAESLSSGSPIPTRELRARMPAAFLAMSPREREFFAQERPDPRNIIDHAWRYEALLVLAWSIGIVAALPFPEAICDVPALAGRMLDLDGSFVESARLRATGELLDALDLHLRLHWVTTESRSKGVAPPAALESGVIQERHHALNWLTCFQRADWDDVDTPT